MAARRRHTVVQFYQEIPAGENRRRCGEGPETGSHETVRWVGEVGAAPTVHSIPRQERDEVVEEQGHGGGAASRGGFAAVAVAGGEVERESRQLAHASRGVTPVAWSSAIHRCSAHWVGVGHLSSRAEQAASASRQVPIGTLSTRAADPRGTCCEQAAAAGSSRSPARRAHGAADAETDCGGTGLYSTAPGRTAVSATGGRAAQADSTAGRPRCRRRAPLAGPGVRA